MTAATTSRASIPEATHHHVEAAGTDVHYVTAGTAGSPVVLVHGFPESWWAFSRLIPRLATRHRVVAVDLPGFGDSGTGPGPFTSASSADSLRALVEHLDLGPVHLLGQDISGVVTYRLAAGHPDLVRSLAAVETALPGHGMEAFADVSRGGVWHVGFLAAPGIPELLLRGRERDFLARYAFPTMSGTAGAVLESDVDEFARVYARPDGLRGTTGFYRSMLTEGEEIRALAARGLLRMPVLAVGAGSGDITRETMEQVATDVTALTLDGVGHLVALEAPHRLAAALLDFWEPLDRPLVGGTTSG